MSVAKHPESEEIAVEVPAGTDPAVVRTLLSQALSSSAAVERLATTLMRAPAELGPATAAQLVHVERLWRHLVDTYGVYTAADIARLRGTSPSNRATASNLARREGLIGVRRGAAKVYPAFEFSGAGVHSRWSDVAGPLRDAGWDDEDILLFLVSPHPALDGREPAALLDTPDVDRVVALVAREAQGVA